jgi:hypothetical protein
LTFDVSRLNRPSPLAEDLVIVLAQIARLLDVDGHA